MKALGIGGRAKDPHPMKFVPAAQGPQARQVVGDERDELGHRVKISR